MVVLSPVVRMQSHESHNRGRRFNHEPTHCGRDLYNLSSPLLMMQEFIRGIVCMRKLCWVLPVLFLNLIASPGFSASGAPTVGGELTVAAAADLNSALTEIAAGFKKQTGITVKLSFGASGALAQQIQNGAPFDLFFSADMDYPKQLADAGQAEASSLYRYAVGGLALWVPADSP